VLRRIALCCGLALSGCGVTQDEASSPEVAQLRQGLQVCAGSATVPGIDVSEWQGAIDWGQVAGAGYKYAITRINDGHHQDPTFRTNWDAIKAVGMIRGAYQFYEPTVDPTTQAQWVINAVGMLGPGDLPVTLDVEWTTGTPNAGDIDSWMLQVAAGTGKIPMIYTAVGYWNSYFTDQFGNLDLWVANYGVSCPHMPSSWDHWLFWQWGGAPVPGIAGNVDQNVFNGDLNALQIVAGQNPNSGCTAGQQLGCGFYGCGCAEGQCSGGFCPGTGCSQAQKDACGAFGCNCVDQKCNGGFCPGSGCTAKETRDCAAFGVNCVDHQCAGGFGPGSGCTARETLDCGNFGCGCVDHQCAGGFCPGTGCTAKETLDCSAQNADCAGHACTARADAGTPVPDAGSVDEDAGTVATTDDAGSPELEDDAGVTGQVDAGPTPRPPDGVTPLGPISGSCSTGMGAPLTPLALGLLALRRRRR
jgi:lysozyme